MDTPLADFKNHESEEANPEPKWELLKNFTEGIKFKDNTGDEMLTELGKNTNSRDTPRLESAKNS